jgi:DNA mismatch repair protein PMS2
VSPNDKSCRVSQTKAVSTKKEADSSTNTSTSPTVWNSFQGTNDVVMASMRDRIAMRDRKRRHHDLLTNRATMGSEFDSHPDAGARSLIDSATTVTLSKEDFRSMTVVGQFNLGFILASSQNGNMWILDQHACDEKWNFEKLCRETIIHEQTLIAPMALELSPSEETCVLDHMDIFERNGFRFAYDDTKPLRHRLSLISLPHSGARDGRKAVQYGTDDVTALCAILGTDEDSSAVLESGGTGTDGSGIYGNNAVRRYATGNRNGETADKIIARLPKTIAMLASRACRGSVMIGKALSEKEMDKIVKRLAEIEHPWNCPHGRPTMRHVGDLQPMLAADEKRAAEHVSGPTVTLLSQDAQE